MSEPRLPILVVVDPDLGELIPTFLDDVQRLTRQYVAALAGPDRDTIRSVGHQLKGIGKPFGFPWIGAVGEAIEAAAAAGAPEELASMAAALRDYLERIDVVYGPPPAGPRDRSLPFS